MPNESLDRWLSLSRDLLSNPTAPLFEDVPQAFVRGFVAARPELQLTSDAVGNLRVDFNRGDVRTPPLVLVAHLDHPGFRIESVEGERVELVFRGWHDSKHARPGTRVQFFERGNAEPTGGGELMACEREPGPLKRAPARVTSGTALPGGFAMWDFPGFSLVENETLVSARCCDDLMGAAAALCTLDELVRRSPEKLRLTALFTRAEELGFYGTLEAIRLKTLPQDACVLSLECSKALATAKQGDGVIVRVGDASSIFDVDLTAALTEFAKSLQKSAPSFKYQRKLMDGGTCEATPFCAHGYRASGLALPMDNYHNQAFDDQNQPCVGPETVRVDDFAAEVNLLVELALHPEALAPSRDRLTPRLKELAQKAQAELNG